MLAFELHNSGNHFFTIGLVMTGFTGLSWNGNNTNTLPIFFLQVYTTGVHRQSFCLFTVRHSWLELWNHPRQLCLQWN